MAVQLKTIRLIASLLIFSSLISFAVFAQDIFVVKDPVANIRSGPGKAYQVIGSATAGQEFIIKGISGEWIRILLPDGDEGWINQNLGTIRRTQTSVEPEKPPAVYKKTETVPKPPASTDIETKSWVFSVKPGIMINATQIAKEFNEHLSMTGGLDIFKTSFDYEEDGSREGFTTLIVLPQIGVKYCFWSANLKPYIQGTIARTFASVSMWDEYIDPEYEDYIHDLFDGIIGVVLSFGTEYCLNKNFTIGGETGFRYFNIGGRYNSDYTDFEVSYRISATYTAITLNFYY